MGGLEPLNRFEAHLLNTCEQAIAYAARVAELGFGILCDTSSCAYRGATDEVFLKEWTLCADVKLGEVLCCPRSGVDGCLDCFGGYNKRAGPAVMPRSCTCCRNKFLCICWRQSDNPTIRQSCQRDRSAWTERQWDRIRPTQFNPYALQPADPGYRMRKCPASNEASDWHGSEIWRLNASPCSDRRWC